jgi:uncharacterized protein
MKALHLFLAFAVIGCAQEPAKEQAVFESAPEPQPVAQNTTPGTPPPAPPPAVQEPKDRRLHALESLQVVDLKLPRGKVKAWVMDESSKRTEGMMWLQDKDVMADQGMLFVFSEPSPRSFWMQNTLIPLDIVFITAKGKVLNVGHGTPESLDSIPSKGDAQYVLELKAGQATRFGLRPGAKIVLPPELKAKN